MQSGHAGSGATGAGSGDPTPFGVNKPGSTPAELEYGLRMPSDVYPLFENALRGAGCRVDAIRNPPGESLYDRVEAGEWDALVVSLYYPPQWGWGTARCHGPESRCLMDGFPFANPAVPAAFVSWASPYHLYEFAFMDPYLNTYGGCPGTQKAAALALLGRIPISGHSPVAQPPFFGIGDGIARPARA